MFEPVTIPRVYSVPLGVDYPQAVVDGLRARLANTSPDKIARTELIVNTARMRRRLRTLFAQGPATLMPRMTLLSELGNDPQFHHIPPATSALARRMELVPLVHRLLESDPRLAVRRSLFDLSDGLASLMSEMQGEGVPLEAITNLDVNDDSGHWVRAKNFISIIGQFLEASSNAPDPDGRMRRVVDHMIAQWTQSPPDHPILMVGSTGSRGTAANLMDAIARLPQGAVILPGVDPHMPDDVWTELRSTKSGALAAEDHPQYRFAHLLNRLDINPSDLIDWHTTANHTSDRMKVLSLALRPAPVTDSWLRDGPTLPDLREAMRDVTLLEANSQRNEALAIAARLRQAAETGQTAALITPDRMLTRQVTAALDRWNLKPDDSAGLPLQLTAPGRFLRHVGDLLARQLTAEALLTLLKHPLTHSGSQRGQHLLFTRQLEMRLRCKGPAFPTGADLIAWGTAKESDAKNDQNSGIENWTRWIAETICEKHLTTHQPPIDCCNTHMDLAQAIAAGSVTADTGELWLKQAGREALRTMLTLRDVLDDLPDLSAREYVDLFSGVLAQGEVRDRDAGHPNVLIWGTLEARVQGADLLILAGLNENSWPEATAPDPWLNRRMRQNAGLLLPERRIGLSAHDFQQGFSAQEVWLTRSTRSDDAETVSSRWLNRLTNLMGGLPEKNGPAAMDDMKARGKKWLAIADALEAPIPQDLAPRPSPRPPTSVRPRQLSVTEIKTLIRDPYAIYAKHVLRLKPLESLAKEADPLLRGIVIHEVFERFIKENPTDLDATRLLRIAREVFEREVDWPSARLLWEARIARIADDFLAAEAERQSQAKPTHFELKGTASIPSLGFTITGRADRIDMDERGGAHLYDYKTGKPPTAKEQKSFDPQLLIMAAMALRDGFETLSPHHVEKAQYLGIGTKSTIVDAPLDEKTPTKIWEDLTTLITKYLDPEQGFTARRAMQKKDDVGRYDHLSRLGEWDTTQAGEHGEEFE